MREQAKLNAAHVRNAVKEEKSKQLNKVAQQLKVRVILTIIIIIILVIL